jgi:hypothetical protein
LGNEWLIESKLSPEIILLDSPTVTIKLQIDRYPFDAFYNPVVGINIMSHTFAEKILERYAINFYE